MNRRADGGFPIRFRRSTLVPVKASKQTEATEVSIKTQCLVILVETLIRLGASEETMKLELSKFEAAWKN